MSDDSSPAFKQNQRKEMIATQAVGKGTKTVGINMKMEMAEESEQRATSMHLFASKYIKIILAAWINSGEKLRLELEEK